MKRSLILFFLMIFVLSISTYAYPGERGIKWWKEPKIVTELGLTSDQVNTIENIFSSYRGRIIDLESKLKQKETEYKNKNKDPNSPRAEIESLYNEVEEIKSTLSRLKVDMFLEIRDLLTPEQRDKLHKIKARYKK